MLCHTRMKLPDLQVFLWLCLLNFGMVVSIIEPGYLDFDNLPDTNFSCVGKVIGGYYADLETNCQMFHVCTIGQLEEPMDIRFLCLNGTVFDQETRVCERVDEVDCSKSEKFYHLNLELYGNTAPPIVEEPEPVLPSKQSVSSTTLRSTTTQPSKRTTYASPTTTHSSPKVVDSHQYPVNNGPDIRFNPEEINIRLTPGNPPIINAPSILPFLQTYSESQIVTTQRNGYKEERVQNAQVTPTPKVVSYGLKHTSKNYQNYDYSYQHTDNPNVDYNTDIPASGYDYHEPSSGRYSHDDYDNEKVQYGPTHKPRQNIPSSTLSIKSLPQVSSTSKPLIQTPQVPTLPPLIFSSPAPFSLLRHIEQKRSNQHHTPPRVIVSASASVSDASGNRLNYSLGTIGTSHIIGTAPSSYDDYKEDDVGLDPFYHDVPKVNSKHNIKKREVAKDVGRYNESHWIPPDYVDDNYEPLTYDTNETKIDEPTTKKIVINKPKVIVHNIDETVLTMLLKSILQNIKNATRTIKKTNNTETPLKDQSYTTEGTTTLSLDSNKTDDITPKLFVPNKFDSPTASTNSVENNIYKSTIVPIEPTEPTTMYDSIDNSTVFNLKDNDFSPEQSENAKPIVSTVESITTENLLSTMSYTTETTEYQQPNNSVESRIQQDVDNLEISPEQDSTTQVSTEAYTPTTENSLIINEEEDSNQEVVEGRMLEEAENHSEQTTIVLTTEGYNTTTESTLFINEDDEYLDQEVANSSGPIDEGRILKELENLENTSEQTTTEVLSTEGYRTTTDSSLHISEEYDEYLDQEVANSSGPIAESSMLKELENLENISERTTTDVLSTDGYTTTIISTTTPKQLEEGDEYSDEEVANSSGPIMERRMFQEVEYTSTQATTQEEEHSTTEVVIDHTTEVFDNNPTEENAEQSTDFSNNITEPDSTTSGPDPTTTTGEPKISYSTLQTITMVPFESTTVPMEEVTKSVLNNNARMDTTLETSDTASLSTTEHLTTPSTTVLPTRPSSTTRYSYLRTREPSWKTNRRTRPTVARHRFSSPAISMSSSVLKLKGLFTTDTMPNKKIVTDSYLSKSVYPTEASDEQMSSTTPIVLKQASFNCIDKKMNIFYADPRDCRLFHYCTPGFNKKQVLDMRFVCDAGTYFDIDKLVCSKNLPVRCK